MYLHIKMLLDLTANIYLSTNLTDKSKLNYKEFFQSLHNRLNTFDNINLTLHEISTNPSIYIPLFKQWFSKHATLKVYISSILSIFKYNPDFKDKYITQSIQWTDAFNQVAILVSQRYLHNQPSHQQINAFVPYHLIIQMRDHLKDDDIRKLLLAMYTYIPPLRCEYSRLRIYHNHLPIHNLEPNYILFKDNSATLLIQHFKTQKTHHPITILLPEPLLLLLHKSLLNTPRDWLFINSKNIPYTTNLYIKWVGRVFKNLFNKPLTISLIRHAYINTLDFNQLTISQKQNIAASMGHTYEMQDKYRLLFNS